MPERAPAAGTGASSAVLIAEDDRTSRDLLAAILRKHGHPVVETRDGEEAWSALQAPGAPRLLLLDWMMPRIDGIELCRRVRATEGAGYHHIIMVTALTDRDHVADGLDAGANDYVGKPVEPLELRARVDAGLRMLAMHERLTEKNREFEAALAQVRTLRGIVPICMHCRRVREDGRYWQRVEEYVSAHTEAHFSHGLCPDCERQYHGGGDADEPA